MQVDVVVNSSSQRIALLNITKDIAVENAWMGVPLRFSPNRTCKNVGIHRLNVASSVTVKLKYILVERVRP